MNLDQAVKNCRLRLLGTRGVAAAILLSSALAGVNSQAAATTLSPAGACVGAKCAITVSNGKLLKDGNAWIPKGVVITGFVAPRGYIKGTYEKARNAWGVNLLSDLKAVGVNTLRFNVSISGLDPQNAMPDGRMTSAQKLEYAAEIVDAVELAQQYGMNVIMTLTAGDPSGDPKAEHVPGPSSVRAWGVLAPAFVNRPSVILNAFNEPIFRGFATVDTDQSPWKRWNSGYQLLVDAIRKTGARNVIMLNGLANSRVWRKNADVYIPKDPANQLAYDIHPFPTSSSEEGGNKFDYQRPADIDYWLDGWCDKRACIASAFFTGSSSGTKTERCFAGAPGSDLSTPKIAENFVNHLTKKNIGVLIFAGDWNNRLFDRPGKPGAKLTSYAGFSGCGSNSNVGPGELMKKTWLSQN